MKKLNHLLFLLFISLNLLTVQPILSYAAHEESDSYTRQGGVYHHYEPMPSHNSYGGGERYNREGEEGYRSYRQSIQSWCRDQLNVLRRAHDRATRHISHGNYLEATKALMKGLENALNNLTSYHSSTFTAKSLQRGLELAQEIQKGGGHIPQLRTLNYFLFEYYSFIYFVSRELDSKFAQRRNCHFCGLYGNREFEKNYVKFAKWQLKMVIDKLTTSKGRRYYREYFPIGSPDAFLSVFAKTTYFMAIDLEDSVFASQLACTIDELHYVNHEVIDHNLIFSGYYEAVQFAGYSAEKILDDFNCSSRFPRNNDFQEERSRRGNSQRDSFNALGGGSLNLYAGTTKTVKLGEAVYIKKLIIQAEGVHRDGAIFDVVVNGDIKGTIFVPGRDPSYFVTVEDVASQIQLISRSGGEARIRQILVIITDSEEDNWGDLD